MSEIFITLDYQEYRNLIDPKWTRAKVPGGFQNLMKLCVLRTDRDTRIIRLTQDMMEKIHRYAFAYKRGGWENGLKAIFSRHLGPKLDKYLIVTPKLKQTEML
jgi:hypothetical protein